MRAHLLHVLHQFLPLLGLILKVLLLHVQCALGFSIHPLNFSKTVLQGLQNASHLLQAKGSRTQLITLPSSTDTQFASLHSMTVMWFIVTT